MLVRPINVLAEAFVSEGIGTKEISRSLRLFGIAKTFGSIEAIYQQGRRYLAHGCLYEAVIVLEEACHNGHFGAACDLAGLYWMDGAKETDSAQKDKYKREAIALYQKSLEGGHYKAASNLAYIYVHSEIDDNDTTERHDAKAVTLFRKALPGNLPCAFFGLGVMYCNGRVKDRRTPEEQQAIGQTLIRHAEKLGNKDAGRILEEMRQQGQLTMERDIKGVLRQMQEDEFFDVTAQQVVSRHSWLYLFSKRARVNVGEENMSAKRQRIAPGG